MKLKWKHKKGKPEGGRRKRGCVPVRIRAACCVLVSLALYGILTAFPAEDSPVKPDGSIRREGYGGEDQQYQLYVDGILEEPFPLTVEVGAKRYTKEGAEEAFCQIIENIEERIRGENPSLTEVRTSLTLPTWLEEYGVRLRWSSSDPELLDSFGKLREAAAEIRDGVPVFLRVQMTADEYRREYEIPVRILPPQRDPKQALTDDLVREIKRRNEDQQTTDSLFLPIEYGGKELHYRSPGADGAKVIPLLGVILAVLCYLKEQADERERERKRERELLLDYPELMSKLMVFMGAGMTVRGAWERIVTDYEAAVLEGRKKQRAAYEEMGQTWRQLQSGMPEGAAYREFGKRCRLQPYLKLSTLLEQNRKTGSKHLRAILQTEMADAFEQRKNLARRLGEEAGTKLLLPLFMMLGIVMVMIMVPAMLTMG